jgi:hypothetical protein
MKPVAKPRNHTQVSAALIEGFCFPRSIAVSPLIPDPALLPGIWQRKEARDIENVDDRDQQRLELWRLDAPRATRSKPTE